jgi:winged helix DNA-binding protein
MPTTLSRSALNRATLARQLLLERSALGVVPAVERVAGLQAQTPHSWYVGLWSRLAGFDPAAAVDALEQRRLVRLALMRSTIHLVTADDAVTLRPTVQPAIERQTATAFGRRLEGLDRDAVVATARRLVDERPLTPAELGRALAETFPHHDAEALAQGARAWLPLVQVPPRGLWGRSGKPAHAALETWVRRRPAAPDPAGAVVRYLAAFGPATAADLRVWSGLPALGAVVEGLLPRLHVFRDEAGRKLLDLPDAPRPEPETPAPPRFLYDYDNVLLSHADRSRVLGDAGAAAVGFVPGSNRRPSGLLVDGFVAGAWTDDCSSGRALLTVQTLRHLTKDERDAVAAEGVGLLRFLHPAATPDIRIVAA